LEENLHELSRRLQRGAYRAKPVKRGYLPKPDGRQRPIGVLVLEDKITQRATVKVLEAIYESDFKGFSYGFRPGRSAHDALDALAVGIRRKKVNWVLDADIRGFFDAIDHEWLVKFIAHRIADRRVIRHIVKWLKAGVMEEGKRLATTEGTPQGGSVSPLLANIYLHYALDLWLDQWRRRRASGEVIFVRYADDFVLGFQYRSDAEKFISELRERLRRFKLELHDDKTRLIEFGRFATQNRKRRGQGKSSTFNFLGFTHICGKTQKGKFVVWRLTMRKRLRAKLKQIKAELRRRMHLSIPVVGQWLKRILQGHYNYYGVPLNYRAMATFRYEVSRLWFKTLRRRSQKSRLNWNRMSRLEKRWLPVPKIRHPYPEQRLRVFT
jgi:group II intron reverse transcriptase/maturase